MSSAKRQVLLSQAISGAATVEGSAMDIMYYENVSVALTVAPGGTLAGTFKLQWSNDGANWVDVPSATASLSGTNTLILNLQNVGTAFVRPVIVSTSGASTVTATAIAKGI